MAIQKSRNIEQIVTGQPTQDGAGVSLVRVLSGPMLQKRLDPYLLFDHFGSDNPNEYIAGFPDHPHRGIETITLMREGHMRHHDSKGGHGILQNGGAQWMTAGKGIIHSEMPEQEGGVMDGFQLWLNLPAARKMIDPWYKDLQPDLIPSYTNDQGVHVRVIAGKSAHVQGYEREITEPLYLQISIPAGVTFEQEIVASYNAFVYVYAAGVRIQGQHVSKHQMGILSHAQTSHGKTDIPADGVVITADTDISEPAQLLLIAGKPLNEPIVQYGPFAMNTREEIIQAIEDYQAGRLGIYA